MPVVKEFQCLASACGQTFESMVPVCTHCGGREAKRVFLTPPGINGGKTTRGSARSIDRLLEREFKNQGISDFSNCGGENKVRYARRVRQLGSGVYGTPRFGINQPPVKAFIGAPFDFSQASSDPLGYGLSRAAIPGELPFQNVAPTAPESIPTIDQGGGEGFNMVEVAKQTPLPSNLARRTRVVRRER